MREFLEGVGDEEDMMPPMGSLEREIPA